jgi:hypothetical protein
VGPDPPSPQRGPGAFPLMPRCGSGPVLEISLRTEIPYPGEMARALRSGGCTAEAKLLEGRREPKREELTSPTSFLLLAAKGEPLLAPAPFSWSPRRRFFLHSGQQSP